MSLPQSTSEVGYREDGILFVTRAEDVPDAPAAARHLGDGWRVVDETWVGPTGEWVNTKDEEWVECSPDAPDALACWRLVDTDMPEIFDGEEWRPNPHHRPPPGSAPSS